MDAFSVSVVNGLSGKKAGFTGVPVIAGTFALFQFIMPMTGWLLVHTAVEYLDCLNEIVPWIALLLLCLIGVKMIKYGIKERKNGLAEDAITDKAAKNEVSIGVSVLMLQGFATSIDALSVGFITAAYKVYEALLSSLIIGLVTFAICAAGVRIGERVGTALSWKASVLGGAILIIIGIKIIAW